MPFELHNTVHLIITPLSSKGHVAKGLFNKAIIQSGTLLNTMTKETSQALGLAVLKNLGLTPNDVQKLDTISYQELVKAGNEAVLKISGPRKPGSPTMFGFAPCCRPA